MKNVAGKSVLVTAALLLTAIPVWAGTAHGQKKLLTASDFLTQKGVKASKPCPIAPPAPSGLITATDLLRLKHITPVKTNSGSPGEEEQEDPWDDGEDMGC